MESFLKWLTAKRAINLLFATGSAVYFLSLFNGFVWDDEEQILTNTLVHSITNFWQFFGGSTFSSGGAGGLTGLYYKPLMSVFFSALYTLFGPHAFFFHLFQVGMHVTNSVLVFTLLRKILPGEEQKNFTLLPFFLAVIFLVHPINVETVVYSSSLQDVLYLFFGLLALLVSTARSFSPKRAAVIVLLLLCSLLSKETGVLFLPVIVLYSMLFRKENLKSIFITTVASFGIYALLRFGIAQVFFGSHDLSPITRASLPERLVSVPKIVYFYLSTFLFPYTLSISQHWMVTKLGFYDFILPFTMSTGIVGAAGWYAYRLYKKSSELTKAYLFFYLWFLMGLGLHLNIFPLDMTVADRWFYFPIVALLGMIAVIIKNLKLFSRAPKFLLGTMIVIITLLTIRTEVRILNWKNGLTLYSHDVKSGTNSFDLENNLGVELFRAGRVAEAKKHFIASTQRAPYWWTNWNNLGAVYEQEGNLEKAEEYYRKAITHGDYYLAYQNVAGILLKQKKYQEAKAFCEESLAKLPQNAQLWFSLAIVHYRLGDKDQARQAAYQSYALMPTQETAYIISHLEQNLSLDDMLP